jgi:hypothetical protein
MSQASMQELVVTSVTRTPLGARGLSQIQNNNLRSEILKILFLKISRIKLIKIKRELFNNIKSKSDSVVLCLWHFVAWSNNG